jgi:flagellar L-ring protein precursor FlgH
LKTETLLASLVLGLAFANASAAQGSRQTLIDPDAFRGPAADQRAYRVGDVLTVLVQETTRARSQAATDTDRSMGFDISLHAPKTDYASSLGVDANTKGAAATSRIGELRAQITVRVLAVEENGLLRIGGNQMLVVNGETQRITLTGVVRPQDISAANTVWSSRIADSNVALEGKGVVSQAQKRGLISRIVGWLGLL